MYFLSHCLTSKSTLLCVCTRYFVKWQRIVNYPPTPPYRKSDYRLGYNCRYEIGDSKLKITNRTGNVFSVKVTIDTFEGSHNNYYTEILLFTITPSAVHLDNYTYTDFIKCKCRNLSFRQITTFLVEATGFEPTTFASRTRRATSCATPRHRFCFQKSTDVVFHSFNKRKYYNKYERKSQSFSHENKKLFLFLFQSV